MSVDMNAETKNPTRYKNKDKTIMMNEANLKYFKELADHAVKEKFSLHEYVVNTRKVLRTRLLSGQRRDNSICIDEQYTEERRRFHKIKRKYRQYINLFEDFLSKNHGQSMKILDSVEEEEKRTNAITETRNNISKHFGQISLEVYQCEENWRMVKKCQQFLYLISPESWRVEHDWFHCVASKETITSFTNNVFSPYKMTDEGMSLDTLIDLFEQDIDNAGPAEIYFKNTSDLIHVFRAMESQHLNSLIYLESLIAPIAEMEMTFMLADTRIKQEINEIYERIHDLEISIYTEELRATVLEEYINKLLYEILKDLVCSKDILYIHVFIENAYESCIAPNDANLDSFTMIKQIEKYHEDLNMQLDNLPHSTVEICEKEGFKQEMKAMREAEDAARKFDLMKRLLDALKRIVQPILVKGRPLMPRSMPVLEQTGVIKASQELTEEQQQYLMLFTEYCSLNKFTSDSELFNNPSFLEAMQEQEDFMKCFHYDGDGNDTKLV